MTKASISELCPECEGGGWTMKCYGGPPTEVACEYCDGVGLIFEEIEIEEGAIDFSGGYSE